MAMCDEHPELYFPDEDGNFAWESVEETFDIGGRAKNFNEVQSTISRVDLVSAIINNLWGDGFYSLWIERQGQSSEDLGEIGIDILDGLSLDSEGLDYYYFTYIVKDEGVFSARFLMEILRDTNLVLFYKSGCGGWVAWDNNVGRISAQVDNLCDYQKKGILSRSRTQSPAMYRSMVTSDHGFTPLLLRKQHADSVRRGKAVVFENPSFIAKEQYSDYCLAFFNGLGDVRVIELCKAVDSAGTLSIRNGIYSIDNAGMKNVFCYSSLLLNAFLMIGSIHPQRMAYFQRLSSVTVFQSGVIAQEFDDICVDYGESLLSFALAIEGRMKGLGEFYLTSGLHPFDNYSRYLISNFFHRVTTPQLYAKAARALAGFGCSIDYDRDEIVPRFPEKFRGKKFL